LQGRLIPKGGTIKDDRLFVKKLGRVGSFDGYEVVGILYEEEINVLHRGWRIMAWQKQYGQVNGYWIENGEFGEMDVDEPEKASILKAIKTWEEQERKKLLGEAI
jgi:hypothetical protein